MAVVSTLAGGAGGFLTFVLSLVFFDASVSDALVLYVLSGLAITTGCITVAITAEYLGKLMAETEDMRGNTVTVAQAGPVSRS